MSTKTQLLNAIGIGLHRQCECVDPEQEAHLETATGVIIAVPAYPLPCSYVRLLRADKSELAYWDHQEWADDPEEVMGAIFGGVCAGTE